LNAERGFTLVELMVVIGVLAILALMALPSYTDKLIRDQVAEALPLADIVKPPVAAAWGAGQPFPADKIVSNFVSAVALKDGAIHLSFGNRANKLQRSKTLTQRPAVVEDAKIVPVAWVCGYAEAPGKMTARGRTAPTSRRPICP
jgi:type IV pilus assembly protein PilA